MVCSGGVVLCSYATLQGATREKETRERGAAHGREGEETSQDMISIPIFVCIFSPHVIPLYRRREESTFARWD
jgi:hypothetical protein